jgi:hypothetical protein
LTSRTTFWIVAHPPLLVRRWKKTIFPANEVDPLPPVTLVLNTRFWKPSPTRGCTDTVTRGPVDVLVLAW